ncbi:hypothetical protein R1X32_10905 (plasmid) [Rhodococcus opacus]|uniref:hypothetical protein n=1 Tax=Rhodococcus opacus TaxID=37919 RepID=UPI0034D240CA
MPLLPLGLPWSLPAILDPYRFDSAADSLEYALYWGPALLSVVLNGLLAVAYSLFRAHHRPRQPAPDGTG